MEEPNADVMDYIWESASFDGIILFEFMAALREHGSPGSATTENAGKLAAHLVRTGKLIPGRLGVDAFEPWELPAEEAAQRIENEVSRFVAEGRKLSLGDVAHFMPAKWNS
ncbi:hypothetical protein [Actinoalloteichus caeruleus]|uniref:hypothetical protein n=1 Tax=Actinoalloteichus cyanogriseus TaxID=2893586 RepID=UPI0004AB0684|nr:hypothetical protein [Actinoalloteichus caeruleus]